MSYLSEKKAENLQSSDVRLVQIPDFEIEYLENHLGALRSVIARCVAFFTLFIWAQLFFDWRFPSITKF